MSNNGFFNSLRGSGFYRAQPELVGGVCAGLAHRNGWSVAPVRIITALILIFFPFATVAYLVAWMLLPNGATGRIILEDAASGRSLSDVVLAGLLLVVTLGMTVTKAPFFWGNFNIGHHRWGISAGASVVLLLGLVCAVWLVIRSTDHNRGPQGPAPFSAEGGQSSQHPVSSSVQQGPQPFAGPHAGPQPSSNAQQPSVGPQAFPNGQVPFMPSPQQFAAPQPFIPAPVVQRRRGPGRTFSLVLLALLMGLVSLTAYLRVSSVPRHWVFLVALLPALLLGLALMLLAVQGQRAGWVGALGWLSAVFLMFAIPVGGFAASGYSFEPQMHAQDNMFTLGNSASEHRNFKDQYEADQEMRYEDDVVRLQVAVPSDVPLLYRVDFDGPGRINMEGVSLKQLESSGLGAYDLDSSTSGFAFSRLYANEAAQKLPDPSSAPTATIDIDMGVLTFVSDGAWNLSRLRSAEESKPGTPTPTPVPATTKEVQ